MNRNRLISVVLRTNCMYHIHASFPLVIAVFFKRLCVGSAGLAYFEMSPSKKEDVPILTHPRNHIFYSTTG